MSMPALATILVKRAEMRAAYAHMRASRKAAMPSDLDSAGALARAVSALTTAYMRAHTQGMLEEFHRCQRQLQDYVDTGILRAHDLPGGSAPSVPAFAAD